MDNFEEIKQLGNGAFCVATLVSNKSTGELFCIKQLDLNKTSLTLDEVKNEVNIPKMFYYPNIIKVFDHFVEDNHCNIVMDYAEGGTLHNKIKFQSELTVPFEEIFILHVFSQVASALYECKKKLVIHADVNPNNIFFTKEG
jgi:NIMA (never in mitosis gene a)-related kinase